MIDANDFLNPRCIQAVYRLLKQEETPGNPIEVEDIIHPDAIRHFASQTCNSASGVGQFRGHQ
jgi:hypothetical protein